MATPLRRAADTRGFSLTEMLVSLAVMSLVMTGVISAMLNATRANDTVKLSTQSNNNLRVAMDLMVRDMLQVGQGLPTGRVVGIPSGAGATAIRRPGPNDPAANPAAIVLTFDPGLVALPALVSGPGLGPVVNGQATDIITTIAADSAFEGVRLTALTGTQATVVPTLNISDTPDVARDNITVGDLIMFTKGSTSTLKAVTAVAGNVITFAQGDPMNLNQPSPAVPGTLPHYVALVPETAACSLPPPNPCGQMVVPSVATRVRMVSYYLDPVDTGRGLRLMRRINARPPTVVAFSMEGLAFTYDLVDDAANPTGVLLDDADLTGTGACAPLDCAPTQARKVNVVMNGRSAQRHQQTQQFLRNTLSTQISLRSLALVDRYS